MDDLIRYTIQDMSNRLPENPSVFCSGIVGTIDAARASMELNRNDDYHAPHKYHYPEVFGWDSSMHAIGVRHVDPFLAASELQRLFRGQWRDGMLPNIQFPHRRELISSMLWNSRLLARGNAPSQIRTSGITQPPLAAEAIWLAGQKLPKDDRIGFWNDIVPRLVRYHEWLYAARCAKGDGLIEVVHPWESGMDNTPPLIEAMRGLQWGKPHDILSASNKVLRMFRKDLQHVGSDERSSDEEAVLQSVALLSLLRNRYDAKRLQDEHPMHIADIGFNSIFARANTVLGALASETGIVLTEELQSSIKRTRDNFSQLKDSETGLFFSRKRDGSLVRIPTAASLLPIYSGLLNGNETDNLVQHLTDPSSFWQPHGIPTVPINSPYFSPARYWSGAVWGNIEWMLATGIARNGLQGLAKEMEDRILKNNPEFHEYHSALTGTGHGVAPFSWSASIRLDLAHRPDDATWRN